MSDTQTYTTYILEVTGPDPAGEWGATVTLVGGSTTVEVGECETAEAAAMMAMTMAQMLLGSEEDVETGATPGWATPGLPRRLFGGDDKDPSDHGEN